MVVLVGTQHLLSAGALTAYRIGALLVPCFCADGTAGPGEIWQFLLLR